MLVDVFTRLIVSLSPVELELRQVLKGCKSKAEADRVVAAYMREAKGRENLNDRILLARKRKETGAQVRGRLMPLS